MKLSSSVILMILAGFSVVLDAIAPAPGWSLCRCGLCRADQLHPGTSYKPERRTLEDLRVALRLDSANPFRWAEFGIHLDEKGDRHGAQTYFDRAEHLGSFTPPVLMVVVNHSLLDSKPDKALTLAYRVLTLTADFDELLFATFGQMGRPLHDFAGTAIPAQRRPAVAWIKWLIPRAPESDLIESWHWLRDRGLADDDVTGGLLQELWRRCACSQAGNLWADWLGLQRGDYLRQEFLFNRRFTIAPRPSPFDWSIQPTPSVGILPREGLQFTFDGSENLSYRGLRQMAPIGPGVYRFAAVVESNELTTNQGPSFHIYDSASPDRLHVTTPMVLGTTPRHTIEVVFTVTAPSCGVIVQLERVPSEKFDNRISGTFTIHEVSLRLLH